jgi:hypothetical protein
VSVQAEILARPAIEATIARYVQTSDEGLLDELALLFTLDGVLTPPGLPACRGRAEIVTFIAASRKSRESVAGLGRIRHHVASTDIRLVGSGIARAVSYFVAMSAQGADHWGLYREKLRTTDGVSWLFQERSVTIEGADPSGWIGSGAGVARFDPSMSASSSA